MMECFVVYFDCAGKVSAVHDSVADVRQILVASDLGQLGVIKTALQDVFECILGIAQLLLQLLLDLDRSPLVLEDQWWGCDARDLRIRDSSRRVVDPIERNFDRRRAGVDSENVVRHDRFLIARVVFRSQDEAKGDSKPMQCRWLCLAE